MGECYFYGACRYTSPKMAEEALPKIQGILKEEYPTEWEWEIEENGDEGPCFLDKSSVYFELEVSHMDDWGSLLQKMHSETTGMVCGSWCNEENFRPFDYLALINMSIGGEDGEQLCGDSLPASKGLVKDGSGED